MGANKHPLAPDKARFESDPFGYSSLAWHKWAMAQTAAGFPVDPRSGPSGEDFKCPVLWLSHAHAMSEAVQVLIKNEPRFDVMPSSVQGIIHSQYHAVSLMLIGYSLEICLKAMLIVKKGIPEYKKEEKNLHKHDLNELSDFIPSLNEKDKVTLRILTHFTKWAGRYPDPGFGKEGRHQEIFRLSEKYAITLGDLFGVAAKVLGHADKVVS